MSFGSFYAGLSGLQTNSSRLSVIGNNLANLNTVGFKTSRVTFEDIFSQPGSGAGVNGAGNPQQVGLGVQTAGIQQVWKQGSMQATGLVSDVAVQGNGFFTLVDSNGGARFTRAGNFTFDREGFMVNPAGHFVQGYTGRDASGSVVPSGSLSNIQIPSGLTAPPVATGVFSSAINLDANATVDDPATALDESDTFSTSLTIYDSLGSKHVLSLNFRPVDTSGNGSLDEWSYEVTVPGDEVAGGTPGTPHVVNTGTVTFDEDGLLSAPTGNVTLAVPAWNNGAAAQSVEWRLFDSNADPLMTGYAGASSTSSTTQDGFAVGQLRVLTIDQNGLIAGVFTNGVTQELAQFALSTFNNENGLLKAGQNTFIDTNSSGAPSTGAANAGGRGIIRSNSLELSNVDITQEFTDLIVSERGYQANSRIITTTDSVIQEALNLKR
ncbi:MAG: flagellar hook protein FlgE [bacterium]|nr:flagellar hook protein FlgE [bacterium]